MPMAVRHVVLVASRHAVPDWAIMGVPLEQEILDDAHFDSSGMVNPTLFAIPLLCPFTYGRPLLDNWDLSDSDVHDQLELDLGLPAKQWAESMALALVGDKWSSFLDVYQAVKARSQLARFLGDRFSDIEAYICTSEPIFLCYLSLKGRIRLSLPLLSPTWAVLLAQPLRSHRHRRWPQWLHQRQFQE